MVSLEEFIKLGLEEKANVVWQNGVFLDNFVEKDRTINLYFYRNYYIEMAVSNRGGNILEIAGFRSLRRLDKYLRKIELHELI